jgi:hypothetical protein
VTTILRSSASRPAGTTSGPATPGAPSSLTGVALIVALASVGAAAAACHPAGWEPADLALAAGTAGLVTWASARAGNRARLVLPAVALVAGTGWVVLVALAALALVALAFFFESRRHGLARVLGATAGGLGCNALLRLPQFTLAAHWRWASAPTGTTALVTTCACAPVLYSAWKASDDVVRHRIRVGALCAGLFVAVAMVGFTAAALVGRRDMSQGIYSAQRGLAAAERGNPTGAASELRTSADAFARARRDFDAPWTWPARLVPVLGQYAHAASELARAGYTVAAPTSRAATQVPYDELTAAPGRIDLSLLRSIVGPVARADTALREASRIVDQLDTSWLPAPLTSRLERYRHHLDSNVPEADRALEAVRLTPDLLGASGPRHYLVLFGNPAESRMLGGYAGAYAELTADGGRLSLTRSGRTEDLPDATGAAAAASNRLGWPLPLYTPSQHLGNVTGSPDFPAAAQAATELFRGALGSHLDGVLYVDPTGLAALVGMVGGIRVPGLDQPLTELNLAQFLLRDQYTRFSVRSERFDFLSATAKETFHLLTTRSLPAPVKLFEQLDPAVSGDHLQLWFADPATRHLLDEVGVSGRRHRDPSADQFDLRTSNLSQNKTDAFLQRTVTYETGRDAATGGSAADVTIDLHNGAPPGLSHYVLSNQWLRRNERGAPPLGSDTMLVAVTTTLALDGASVDGVSRTWSSHPTSSGDEPDGAMHRYVTTVTVPAGATVEIRLHLRGGRSTSHSHGITFVHQPLANADHIVVLESEGSHTRRVAQFTLAETHSVAVTPG